jgi:LPS export ABC transporter protein LptC
MIRRSPAMQVKTWYGIVFLSLLALLLWQIAKQPQEIDARPPGPPDMRLNYALYDFNGRLLDERGSVKLSMTSPVLRNDAESGIGTLDFPEIHIQQEHDQWYINAESAIISPDREVVTLNGDVNMSRLNELTGQTLDIATTDVVLNVTPRTAMTDASVRIRQSGDALDAVGMKLDMIEKRYELLHEVRAHYETQ